jgi:hypothetical protein
MRRRTISSLKISWGVGSKRECGPSLKAEAKNLWESYRKFAEAKGEYAGSMKSFSKALGNAGSTKKKSGDIFYLGIDVKDHFAMDVDHASNL